MSAVEAPHNNEMNQTKPAMASVARSSLRSAAFGRNQTLTDPFPAMFVR
jgi:hypothetical protein